MRTLRSARSLALLATAAAAAILAACGTEERQEFAAEADPICADAARAIADARAEAGSIRGAADEAGLLVRVNEVRRDLVRELAELEPPADRAADFADFLRARRDVVAAGEAELEALRAGSRPALAAAREASSQARAEARASATLAGFEECAERLSEDAREEVNEAVAGRLIAADPDEFCNELTTERLLVEEFGGEQRCARAWEELEPATSVRVLEASGVADVAVEAVADVAGGELPGRVRVRLAFEDGRYKVDALERLLGPR